MKEKQIKGGSIDNTTLPANSIIAENNRTAKNLITRKIEKAEPLDERIPFVLPGLNLLAGRPKEGKSWLVLLSCLIFASENNKVLFVSEDTDDVVIERLQIIQTEREKAEKIYNQMLNANQISNEEYLNKLEYVAYDFERALKNIEIYTIDALQVNQSFEELLNNINEHYDIVVIDTMNLLLHLKAHENEYTKTMKFMISMKQLQKRMQAKAVILTHHLRKDTEISPSNVFDNVLGSIGSVGGADTVIVLERIPMSLHLHVYFETKRASTQGKGTYTVINENGRISEIRKNHITDGISEQQKAIVEAIIKITRAGIEPTPSNIANALQAQKISYATVRAQLSRLMEDNILKKVNGKYYVNSL